MCNADFLSRAPIEGEKVKFIDVKDTDTFTSKELAARTAKDEQLRAVTTLARDGWPESSKGLNPLVLPFFSKRREISVDEGCLLWGSRIIIPECARKDILQTLHISHPGIVKMKTLARQYVYWPGIDKDIEALVGKCQACQETRADPPRSTHPWERAEKPWCRLHIDHAGPFQGKLFLIVVDSFSRWMDVSVVSSTASGPTIARLRELFATHGLPDVIVSDNGRGFASSEFLGFCNRNGIQHYRVAPYMASSNGLAERGVRTAKEFLKKLKPHDDIAAELANFMLVSHVTSTQEGKSPSELLMGRRVETYFDKLKPDKKRSFKEGEFKPLQPIWARSYTRNRKEWLKGTIVQQVGHRVYSVEFPDGRVHKRHKYQLRNRVVEEDESYTRDVIAQPPSVVSDTESIYEDADEEAEDRDTITVEAEVIARPEEVVTRPQRMRKQTSFYGVS